MAGSRNVLGWLLIVSAFAAGLWLASRGFLNPPLTSEPVFRLSALKGDERARAFTLSDGEGRDVSLGDFRGRVVLMFFGFTHCPDVCPTELYRLSQLMKALGKDASAVQVLFISLDPERDSSAMLRDYAAAFHPGFLGLTGTRQQIDALAASFYVAHVKVGPQENYTIDHSAVTYVIDPQGRLRMIGRMDTPIDDYVHDIRLMRAESARGNQS